MATTSLPRNSNELAVNILTGVKNEDDEFYLNDEQQTLMRQVLTNFRLNNDKYLLIAENTDLINLLTNQIVEYTENGNFNIIYDWLVKHKDNEWLIYTDMIEDSPWMEYSKIKFNRDLVIYHEEIKAKGGTPCPKCKSTETTYEAPKQRRSADEPMTVYARCTACGKRWKVS